MAFFFVVGAVVASLSSVHMHYDSQQFRLGQLDLMSTFMHLRKKKFFFYKTQQFQTLRKLTTMSLLKLTLGAVHKIRNVWS